MQPRAPPSLRADGLEGEGSELPVLLEPLALGAQLLDARGLDLRLMRLLRREVAREVALAQALTQAVRKGGVAPLLLCICCAARAFSSCSAAAECARAAAEGRPP